MKVVWCEEAAAFDRAAADRLLQGLHARDKAFVALPTGRTPLGLYSELARRAAGGVGLPRRARYINLDEFVGLGRGDPQSYAAYLQRHFLEPARIDAERVYLLRGDAPDLAAECRDADAVVARWGGLDLAVLGLGENGHIAFNEPGSDWSATTHVVRLTEQTRASQAPPPPGAPGVPEQGITLGIATLRAARRLLLLVRGASKREALAALLRGTVDPNWPVTSLIGHPDLLVLADAGLRPMEDGAGH